MDTFASGKSAELAIPSAGVSGSRPDGSGDAAPVADRLQVTVSPSPPRRILAIDGGGVRCVLAMEILAGLERRLQQRCGDPHILLSDRFDLVAGTSAGGLLACGIALRIPMDEIRLFVRDNVFNMFRRSRGLARLRSLYDKRQFASALQDRLGPDTTLGSARLATGLLMFARNLGQDREWLLTNRSGAAPDGSGGDAHLELPLWQLALASAAAPGYFVPETVRYGLAPAVEHLLDDGGMVGCLNPAFRSYRYAVCSPFGPRWLSGENDLTLVSIGSGDAPFERQGRSARPNVFKAVLGMPNALMQASVREQDTLCRQFGRLASVPDDSVSAPPEGAAHFRYHRINPSLAAQDLATLGLRGIRTGDIMRMDSPTNLDVLSVIGAECAKRDTDAVLADCL